MHYINATKKATNGSKGLPTSSQMNNDPTPPNPAHPVTSVACMRTPLITPTTAKPTVSLCMMQNTIHLEMLPVSFVLLHVLYLVSSLCFFSYCIWFLWMRYLLLALLFLQCDFPELKEAVRKDCSAGFSIWLWPWFWRLDEFYMFFLFHVARGNRQLKGK